MRYVRMHVYFIFFIFISYKLNWKEFYKKIHYFLVNVLINF